MQAELVLRVHELPRFQWLCVMLALDRFLPHKARSGEGGEKNLSPVNVGRSKKSHFQAVIRSPKNPARPQMASFENFQLAIQSFFNEKYVIWPNTKRDH